MNDDQRHPVDLLAEEYAMRLRAGEKPSLEDYVARFPEHAESIRAIFPSIALVERVSQREENPSSVSPSRAAARIHQGPPETLGDFQILSELGRGGMGVVYEALQLSLKRRVALKVIENRLSHSDIQRERFRREAESAAALHHTNIVPVFGIGEDQGQQYYAMQLIEGVPLSEVVHYLNEGRVRASSKTRPERPSDVKTAARSRPTAAGSAALGFSAIDAARSLLGETTDQPHTGANTSKNTRIVHDEQTLSAARPNDSMPSDSTLFEPKGQSPDNGSRNEPKVASPARLNASYDRRVVRLVAQIANALQHAHRQGVLHRDIKPGNLLLDRDGTVWVADFGLALKDDFDGITYTGEIVGTLKYMAPEQLRGHCDERSDIYSLGVTLFELLTLRPAIESPQSRLAIGAHRESIPSLRSMRREIPIDLETIALKACNFEPRHRYQTAADFEHDLHCFLEDRPISARPITLPERLWRWSRRNPAIATLSAATCALLVSIAGLVGYGYWQKQKALAAIEQQYERAEQSLKARAEALAVAQRERLRAETNLELAIEAFEGIIENVASRGGAEAIMSELEGDIDSIASADAMLSTADIALLENMLSFFDKFARENGADLGLQTAQAHRRVGNIQQQLGRLLDAEKSYKLALATCQSMLKSESAESVLIPQVGATLADESALKNQAGDSSAILLQASIMHELMILSAKRGDLKQALANFEEAKKLLESSRDLHSSREGRFALAKTLGGFVSLGSRFGFDMRPKSRFPLKRGPLQAERAAIKNNPLLATRVKRETEANAEALRLLQELVSEDSRSAAYRLALSRAFRDNVRICRFEDNLKKADESLKSAIDLLEDLCREFPDSDAFKYQLADTLCTPITLGPAEAARLARATKLCDELIAKQPNVPEYRALRASTLSRSAGAQFASNRKDQAIDTLSAAVAYQRELVQQFPDIVLYRITLVQSLQDLVDMYVNRKDVEAAIKTLDEAIDVTSHVLKQTRFPNALNSLLNRMQERSKALRLPRLPKGQ